MNVAEYERLRRAILQALGSQEFTRDFGRGEVVREAVDTMIRALDIVARGGRTGVGVNTIDRVRKGTYAVMEKVIYAKHTKFLQNFAMMYADLLVLFNKELAYVIEFDILADAIRSIVRSHLTIMEAIDVLRNLLDRAEKYLKLEPPAYAVSRHFLEMVWKKLESGEEVGDYPNKATMTVNKVNACKTGDCK